MFDNINIELLYLLRILIAGICGFIIGIERSTRFKDAGLRTHFIVAAGAALITCVSLYFESDSARIAAQIVSGIGFLGAGMIFFRRESLHGLTTAAGVWATAGIGMACGCGLYVLAICTTLIIVGFQLFFHNEHVKGKNDLRILSVKFYYNEEVVSLLRKTFKFDKFIRVKMEEQDGKLLAEAVINTFTNCDSDMLSKLIIERKDIISIERLED